METGELRLDEGGLGALQRWLFEDHPTDEQYAWVVIVLDGLAVKRPHRELGLVAPDSITGDYAITCPTDATVTVIVIPFNGQDADEFSLRYVGDLAHLD